LIISTGSFTRGAKFMGSASGNTLRYCNRLRLKHSGLNRFSRAVMIAPCTPPQLTP